MKHDKKEFNELLKRSKFEDEILELIYSQEEYTTSDLQGRVSAIVLNIIRAYTG